MKKWMILIPSLVATASMPFIGLVGCGNEPEPEEPRPIFNTCDWSLIVEACNDLENGIIDNQTFCDTFYIDGDLEQDDIQKKKPTSLDDFVGQPRYITVNSQPHQVIVLDHQKDIISDSDKKASLTFQFTNVICNNNGEGISIFWDDESTINYWDSTLFHKLNDEQDEEILSVYEMIEADNEDLAKQIKSVNRTVMTGPCAQDPVLVTNSTKLFEPTLADVFSQQGIINADWKWIKEDSDAYIQEGSQYAYYALEGNIHNDILKQYQKYNCLGRYDLQFRRDQQYWFTSLYRIGGDTQAILRDGIDDFYPSYGIFADDTCMAPCFCI